VGDTPPSRARLFRYPASEHLGLVWVYSGETPAYDPPRFTVDEEDLELYTCRSVELPMDPFVLYSNSMDLQHLVSLHGVKFESMPSEFDVREHSISYSQDMTAPKLGRSTQHVTLFGTNCIRLESEVNGRRSFLMSAGLCVEGPMTRTFNISATIKAGRLGRPGGPVEKLRTKLHVRLLDAFGKKLNAEDDPIFRSISPRLDNLSASDRALQIFFDYVKRYPRSHVAEDLIRNDYRSSCPAG
jgi:hypothetical protein